MKVLVVEDDETLLELICTKLKENGFLCEGAENAQDALLYLKAEEFDVICLDIMLGKDSGINLCKDIRDLNKESSIVFISAIADLSTKTKGFEDCLADDYLTKPFSIEELILRIKAVVRRKHNIKDNIVKLRENVLYDMDKKVLIVDGEEKELTKKLACIIETLILKAGKLVSYETLMQNCWDMAEAPSQDSIRTHLKLLRKLLKEENKDIIRNVPGLGYRLV
jgi:DNA-binding response OmpR family regulator